MSLSIVTLNPIVQKQGALLLKEVVNYTLFMAKTAANLTLWGCMYLYMPYKRETRAPSLE